MKKIYAKVRIINYEDIAKAASGMISPDEIRSVELEGRIDTGATHLSIPEDIAEKLGLRKLRSVSVKYGDGRIGHKWLGSVVQIELNNREACVRPVIEDKNTEVLIGNPILEEMDLFINPKTGEIYPNPESPNGPLVELL